MNTFLKYIKSSSSQIKLFFFQNYFMYDFFKVFLYSVTNRIFLIIFAHNSAAYCKQHCKPRRRSKSRAPRRTRLRPPRHSGRPAPRRSVAPPSQPQQSFALDYALRLLVPSSARHAFSRARQAAASHWAQRDTLVDEREHKRVRTHI